jgi:hypothetical protein
MNVLAKWQPRHNALPHAVCPGGVRDARAPICRGGRTTAPAARSGHMYFVNPPQTSTVVPVM